MLVAKLVTPAGLQGTFRIWVLVGHQKDIKKLCTLYTIPGLQQVAYVYRNEENINKCALNKTRGKRVRHGWLFFDSSGR